MRSRFFILALFTGMLATDIAQAQWRGGNGRSGVSVYGGTGSYGSGFGIGVGTGSGYGYGSPYYGGNGYYNNGSYYGGNGYYNNGSYYGGNGYYNQQPYYYSSNYYVPSSIYYTPSSTYYEPSSSYYTPSSTYTQGSNYYTPGSNYVQPANYNSPINSNAETGMRITEVVDSGAAKKAKLRQGDIIISAGSKRTQTFEDLQQALSNANGEIELRFLHGGTMQSETMKITPVNGKLGISVVPMNVPNMH